MYTRKIAHLITSDMRVHHEEIGT